MNLMGRPELARAAEEIVRRMTVELEASGRHVHLSRADARALFGEGYRMEPVRALSQPGQFVCRERVSIVGPKGEIPNAAVLGPERGESQVEISLTDAALLGVTPPVRLSGDLAGTPGITLRWGGREITLARGLIAAKRHIHMTPEDAARFGAENGQEVRLRCLTARPVTFSAVEVRVSRDARTFAHLDFDEANACGYKKGGRGLILI